MELENIVANTVYLKAREGEYIFSPLTTFDSTDNDRKNKVEIKYE